MLEHLTRQGVTERLELVLVDRGGTAAGARKLGRRQGLEVRRSGGTTSNRGRCTSPRASCSDLYSASVGVTPAREIRRLQTARSDRLRTRKRRMVASPDRALLIGSRSVLARPGDEKRMPSPSRTGSTYTRISSTSPRCRHWPATSAPRISRFLPPAASSAVATASPMSPVRIVTFGFGGSSGLWVRRNMGPEKG